MSNEPLFGETRRLVGYAEQEWAVWVSGTDDIHEKDTLSEALELANELNAVGADMRARGGEHSVVIHAVVLHHGYAWTSATEHAHGVDCGAPTCDQHEDKRAAKAEVAR